MPRYETKLAGGIYDIAREFNRRFIKESLTATLVGESTVHVDGVNTVTQVYERYALEDLNRATVTIYLAQGTDGVIHTSAITAGGAVSYRQQINQETTVGERNLLADVIAILESLNPEAQLPDTTE